MSEEQHDVKPDLQAEEKPVIKSDTHLNIKVTDGNSEIFFKIKRSTPLKRLMEAFAKRQGKSLESIRFLSEGDRINGEQTPEDLDLEDGDVIEAHQEQVSSSSIRFAPWPTRFTNGSNTTTDWWLFLTVTETENKGLIVYDCCTPM